MKSFIQTHRTYVWNVGRVLATLPGEQSGATTDRGMRQINTHPGVPQ